MKNCWFWDWISCSTKMNVRAVLLQSSRPEALKLTLLSLWWDVNTHFRARPSNGRSTREEINSKSLAVPFTTRKECATCGIITWKQKIWSKIFQKHLIDPRFNHLSIFCIHMLSVKDEHSKLKACVPFTQTGSARLLFHPFFETLPQRSKVSFCMVCRELIIYSQRL